MSEAFSVVYSQEAKDDLLEIYAYIAQDLKAPDAAAGQVNRIRGEIGSLDFMPSRYECVNWEPWKSMGMHKVSVDRFVIFYLIDEERHIVTVVRIFYGGRDIKGIIKASKV